MSIKSKLNPQKIKTIFRTMEYGEVTEDTSAVKDWFNGRNNSICAYGGDDKNYSRIVSLKDVNSGEKLVNIYIPNDNVKEKIENSLILESSWRKLSCYERTKLINKFAAEIEKNVDFICKIESVTRGLLPKDTKKYGVSLFLEYLQYYATWTYYADNIIDHYAESTVIYATDNTCLGALGFALGPALAQGSSTIFHVDPALSVCVAFLIELSRKVGIPEGVLKLMLSGDELWTPKDRAMLYLIGDVHNQKFKSSTLLNNKEVVIISNSKTPIVIFNSSDIDSACECVISAVWEYGGMLPWSADTILVQEGIYSEFVEKLKQRLNKIRVGSGVDKLAEISSPPPNEVKKLTQMIGDARAQGIDVYQPKAEHSTFNSFTPTVFIGMKVYNNNVIDEYKNVSPAATITAFRTPKEAISLANNNRQGYACSVWTDSIALVNEITQQLNVGTVWVNSHGLVKPNVPFTTYKLDGVGYIGGSPGFYECPDQERCRIIDDGPLGSIPIKIINAKKARTAWSKLCLDDRIQLLLKCAVELKEQGSKKNGSTDTKDLVKSIYDCVEKIASVNTSRTINGFELNVKQEPVGVVCVMAESKNVSVVLGAIILGNAVLVSNNYFEELSKLLPSGLLGVLESKSFKDFSLMQNDPQIIFINPTINTTFKQFSLGNWEAIVRRCTLLKNIWTPIGDSL